MSKSAKLGITVVAIGLVLGLAWANRVQLALKGVSFAMDMRLQVGPNVPISWSSGSDPSGRSAGERPPNIVLILADDLGWNDLTFNGGGVAGGTVPTPNIDSLANDGVSFTNGYAANATCGPSNSPTSR